MLCWATNSNISLKTSQRIPKNVTPYRFIERKQFFYFGYLAAPTLSEPLFANSLVAPTLSEPLDWWKWVLFTWHVAQPACQCVYLSFPYLAAGLLAGITHWPYALVQGTFELTPKVLLVCFSVWHAIVTRHYLEVRLFYWFVTSWFQKILPGENKYQM